MKSIKNGLDLKNVKELIGSSIEMQLKMNKPNKIRLCNVEVFWAGAALLSRIDRREMERMENVVCSFFEINL